MDSRTHFIPDGYYVRVYDDRLVYRRHCVNCYKTEETNVLICAIHKLSVKVVVQILDDKIMSTYIGKNKGTFKMPRSTEMGEVLKVGFSSALNKPVTIESSFYSTLF